MGDEHVTIELLKPKESLLIFEVWKCGDLASFIFSKSGNIDVVSMELGLP